MVTPASKVNVFDVAKYILKKEGDMSAMKLQKLVYYCQAWSLVWDDEALFDEDIEAWANGPVCRSLYNAHRGMFQVSKSTVSEKGKDWLLSDDQKETINIVLGTYADKSSQWLSDQTHSERPWIEAREGLSDTERGAEPISLEVMAEYYGSLPA